MPDTETIKLVLALSEDVSIPDSVGLEEGEFEGGVEIIVGEEVMLTEIDGVLDERLRKPESAFKKKGAVMSDVVVSYPVSKSHRQISIKFTPWVMRKSTKGGNVKLVQR